MCSQDNMGVVPPPNTQTVKKTISSVVVNIICRAYVAVSLMAKANAIAPRNPADKRYRSPSAQHGEEETKTEVDLTHLQTSSYAGNVLWSCAFDRGWVGRRAGKCWRLSRWIWRADRKVKKWKLRVLMEVTDDIFFYYLIFWGKRTSKLLRASGVNWGLCTGQSGKKTKKNKLLVMHQKDTKAPMMKRGLKMWFWKVNRAKPM